MFLAIPLNAFVASVIKRMQDEQMKHRDKRTRLMSELLANIKRLFYSFFFHKETSYFSNSIKLYAWEFAFNRRVLAVRNDDELRMLKKISFANVRLRCEGVLLTNTLRVRLSVLRCGVVSRVSPKPLEFH